MEMTVQETNPLKDRIRKVLETSKDYRSTEIRYLTIFMKEQQQDDLMAWIEELTLEELNIAFGAGIPGEAFSYALSLAMVAKARIREQQQMKLVPETKPHSPDESPEGENTG